jgi:transcriptional regulator with XRE-family HTH domain
VIGGETQLISTIEIGKRLRTLRNEKGLTLQRVSDDTGLGVSALTMYEIGQRVPRDEAKIILADYYKVSINDLFFAQNFTNRESTH